MTEPCCAVCGESKSVNLLMFNYGMCLCHRCTEMATQSFIHDTAERKLKESEKDVEGLSKAEYESMRELKDKLLKEIEADVEAKVRADIEAKKRANRVAEEAAQIRMADLSIENNRLRTGLKDLKEEYESFRDRTRRVWWAVTIAGISIGMLLTLMFLNPK